MGELGGRRGCGQTLAHSGGLNRVQGGAGQEVEAAPLGTRSRPPTSKCLLPASTSSWAGPWHRLAAQEGPSRSPAGAEAWLWAVFLPARGRREWEFWLAPAWHPQAVRLQAWVVASASDLLSPSLVSGTQQAPPHLAQQSHGPRALS
jgi:hypothetical protein